MNPLKCAFGVSAGKVVGFIIHEKSIEMNPKGIEAMNNVEALFCKKDLQKILGKVNFFRRFIFSLSGKIDAFTHIFRINNRAKFTLGAK